MRANAMYLTPTSSKSVLRYGDLFGFIISHRIGIRQQIKDGAWWALDNDVYNGKFDFQKWHDILIRLLPYKEKCLFIAVPDVLYDAKETLRQFTEYTPLLDELGYRKALVTQNGMTVDVVPWNDLDAIFVGGDNKHKLGTESSELIAEARTRGKWVHIGRVNSPKRMLQFWNADSWDGTTLCFEPSSAKRIAATVREIRAMRKGNTLWDM